MSYPLLQVPACCFLSRNVMSFNSFQVFWRYPLIMLWDLNETMKSREAKGKLCLSETLFLGVSVMSECAKSKYFM